MDKDKADKLMQTVGDRIKQRSENRQQVAEERKTELEKNVSSNENINYFYKKFSAGKAQISNNIENIEQSPNSMQQLESVLNEIQELQKYLNESSMYLPPFQIKKSQEAVDNLNENYQSFMQKLFPPKKFGFRKKPVKASNTEVEEYSERNVIRKETPHNNVIPQEISLSNFVGFKDESNKTLIKDENEVKYKQLNLQNLDNCTVITMGTPSSLQFSNISNCKIIIGPTSHSAFIKNCKNSTFIIACQQVRIHTSVNCNFYLHVTSAVIIEDCNEVRFAPYNLNYEKINEHFYQSSLNESLNNWDKVVDFCWLNLQEKSPNFSIIQENDRKTNWLSGFSM